MTIRDLISELENELSNIAIPEEKAIEIKAYLDKDKMNHHSKQTIINILVSIPAISRSERLTSILGQLSL
ncbi:hypothetical protein [Epilithonimonas caeni]|uniref:hypothetical protein n=1 Tax=Epilithonimonas caeni TaxID=365343 RepID=UPI0004108AB9|nr:hypothetical protein [Epilithonimonas caeni]